MFLVSFLLKKASEYRSNRSRRAFHELYSNQFKGYLERQHFENSVQPGEKEYIEKWGGFGEEVEPYSYRLYCHYSGFNPNIIPEDIGHTYIESALNPIKYRSCYSDKNFFPIIIGKENVPRTVLCRIQGGHILDGDYKQADKSIPYYAKDVNRLILKPSVDSCSGIGVKAFNRQGDNYLEMGGGKILDMSYLQSFSDNFILQEAVEQHSVLENLCPTSVNTIRLCVYRSIKDERAHVTAAVLRIGKNGSIVDNGHSGGCFASIDINTGTLGKFVHNQFGDRFIEWNGINYSENDCQIPNWGNVLDFAVNVGSKILHHRMIALDVALNRNAQPVLIEYNLDQFSYWLFQYSNQEVFGEYTDEVLDYCMNYHGRK